MLGAATAALRCCLGSRPWRRPAARLWLGLAGVALPAATLIGIGAWTAWYLVCHG